MHGLKDVRNRRDDALTRIEWSEFERLLAEYFRGVGWEVEHCGTGAGQGRFDGGVDLKLRRANEYVLVQCKHWNTKQVPHNAVHELLGIKANDGATGAILITSGEFTRGAIEAATRNGHVQLIDGDDLRAMLGPLPEPERPTTGLDRVGRTDAIIDMVMKSQGRGGRNTIARTAKNLVAVKLFGLVVIVLIVIGTFFAIQHMFGNIARDLQRPAQSRVPAVAKPESTAESPRRPTQPRRATQVPSSAVQVKVMETMSPAELEAWKRKNAESMEIIRKTTPELQ